MIGGEWPCHLAAGNMPAAVVRREWAPPSPRSRQASDVCALEGRCGIAEKAVDRTSIADE